MNSKQILFVDFLSSKRIETLQAAKKLGYKLALAAPNLPEAAREYVDRFIEIDLNNSSELLTKLKIEHEKEAFNGVVSFWDRHVETVAEIARGLGLNGNTLLAAACTRNKLLMRQTLKDHDVAIPKFHSVKTLMDLNAAAEHLGFPFILKPVSGCSSKGIFRIDEASSLDNIFDQICEVTQPSRDAMFAYNSGEYIAESMMIGDEYSVEGIADGKEIKFAGITKKWIEEQHFHEVQHVFPAELEKNLEKDIFNLAGKALTSVGFENSAFHLEVMVTEGGPKVVEINGRLGGDFITTHLVPLGRGVDIIEETLKVALGEIVNLTPKWEKTAAVRFMISDIEGKVESWDGEKEAKDSDGIRSLYIERKVGELVRLPPEKYGEVRLAALIGQSNSQDDVIKKVTKGIGLLKPRLQNI